MIEKREKFILHPSKRYLGVECVTKWYKSQVTTLDLLWLMNELNKI
jgi:hypothetical protein